MSHIHTISQHTKGRHTMATVCSPCTQLLRASTYKACSHARVAIQGHRMFSMHASHSDHASLDLQGLLAHICATFSSCVCVRHGGRSRAAVCKPHAHADVAATRGVISLSSEGGQWWRRQIDLIVRLSVVVAFELSTEASTLDLRSTLSGGKKIRPNAKRDPI